MCGKACVDVEYLRRHVAKSHRSSTEEYVLRFELNGITPICKCGCGQSVTWHQPSKRFNEYVHGHHAQFRRKSDEEKSKIGRANAINMTRYMQEHPEIATLRGQQLMTGATPESKHRATLGMKRFWSSDSPETKAARSAASHRAIDLLSQGKIGPQAPFKRTWMTNPFTGKEELMHSSWEAAFLDKCYKEQYPVTKVHDLKIPYIAPDGSEHIYIPDFIGLEDKDVFEVKGHMTATDVAKLNALIDWAKENDHQVVFWRPDGWEILWSPDPNFNFKGYLSFDGCV